MDSIKTKVNLKNIAIRMEKLNEINESFQYWILDFGTQG